MTTKDRFAILAGFALVAASSCVRAEIIFSQDFSTTTLLKDYYNVSQPDSGQWNSIFGGTIANQALSFTRGSSICSFTRNSNFSPVPQALIYQFDIEVASSSAQQSAAYWQVGWNFSSTLNDVEPNANLHSRVALNLTGGSGFSFRDVTDSPAFSGRKRVTWVINNSGESLRYYSPGGQLETIQNDRWDLWVGDWRVFDERTAITPTVPLTDLKFVFKSGSGTVVMDNFRIESVQSVPEPALTGVFGSLCVGLALLVRRRRNAPSGNQHLGPSEGAPKVPPAGSIKNDV